MKKKVLVWKYHIAKVWAFQLFSFFFSGHKSIKNSEIKVGDFFNWREKTNLLQLGRKEGSVFQTPLIAYYDKLGFQKPI